MTQNSAPVLYAIVLANISKPGQSNTEVIELFDKGAGQSFIFEILLKFSEHQIFVSDIETDTRYLSVFYIAASANLS